MADGKFVAYYRVSTAKQGKSGLGLDAQKAAVLAYLNGGAWTLLSEFTEVESGKRVDRRELTRALDYCRLTGATLVIAKLDRLARNMAFTANLMDSGIDFVACDNPHATRFTIHILAAVAEHEQKAISARTKAALAQSTKCLGGWRGGPVVDHAKGTAAKLQKANSFAGLVFPTIAALQQQGMSLHKIAASLDAQGVRTAQNGSWTATAVRRVLVRV